MHYTLASLFRILLNMFEALEIHNEDGLLFKGDSSYIMHIWDAWMLNDDGYGQKYNGLNKPTYLPKWEDLDHTKMPIRIMAMIDRVG